ncbi:hypothetical protein GCM10022297_12450 [Lactobacillus hamsteri]|uniref:XRE family transcriptional regulator n=1 Tax=Lactobacillus hamsteri DSM 5661 = JCM 6256 TaxID=1423754 RepID=A0A0R1YK93_9LACO|nr:helix-turn-helix transcriptional regulator [Lactobacillus hamsteri]KRM40363.1 XRE family transcriptional regulator [Lactobacillus hamsteri DSM 5661 = JCM 6256]
MTIGDKLKKVRFSLGLSQEEMANGVINRSFYSRIESGKNNINVSDLLKLLQANQIPLILFLDEFGDTQPKNQYYYNKVIDNYFSKDIKVLKEISNDPDIANIKLQQITNLLIAKLEGNMTDFSDKTVRKLKYNVLQSGHWDKDSLWILLNTMDLYNFYDLQGLVDSIFNKFSDYKENDDQILQLLASIAVGYLNLGFEYTQLNHEMQKAIKFLKDLPASATIVLQKMLGSCFEAVQKKKYNNLKNEIFLLIDLGYKNIVPIKLIKLCNY